MERLFCLLSTLLLLGTATAEELPGTPTNTATGKQLYQQLCASCHGVQFDGKGPAARAVFPAPANLIKHVKEHSMMGIMHPIMHGDGAMPSWRNIVTHEEAFSIAKYLQNEIK